MEVLTSAVIPQGGSFNFCTTRYIIIAPQAQLEESANDRSKPEEPISRVLMRSPGSGIEPVFVAFPEDRKRFEGSKQGSPTRLR